MAANASSPTGKTADRIGNAAAPAGSGDSTAATFSRPGKPAPVVLVNVGTYSGPPGEAHLPMLQGAQMWVKYRNERGGFNGHELTLVVYDDGGDPARHRAQVQEAIERRGGVAFLMNGEGITGESSVGYITEKRVPVIGSTSGEPWAYTSPMYFPQISAGSDFPHTIVASIAGRMAPKGKTKLGSVTCVEAQICTAMDRAVAEDAPNAGLQLVYRGRASLAQPDYTAECLSAHNAGAEILLVLEVSSAVQRVAAACTRQGYRPQFATIGQASDDRMKTDPNLDGLIVSSASFPYVWSGTPATDEFQEAVRSYGGRLHVGLGMTIGWTAGKLLEGALDASSGADPSSQAILEGLWSIKNDTLGGLTQPLTFVKERPPTTRVCWFDLTVEHGAWTSPDAFQLHCASPSTHE